MSTRTIAVVSAGMGTPSSTGVLADRLAQAARRALAAHDVSAVIESVELRDLAHALTDNLLTGFAGEDLQAAKDSVACADAVIAVTPIYSGSYTGLFKTFFDLLEPGSLVDIPVLIGATAGTPRHSLALDHALRPLFAYLRAVVVPTGVFAASEDWGAAGPGRAGTTDGGLSARVDRAAGQLAALTIARPRTVVADPFAITADFEQLLSRRSR